MWLDWECGGVKSTHGAHPSILLFWKVTTKGMVTEGYGGDNMNTATTGWSQLDVHSGASSPSPRARL